jgi:hypothetical protein
MLTKEQILGKKASDQSYDSKFWDGELKWRPASSGDRIAAKQKAKVILELSGDKEMTSEHIEAATFMVGVAEPQFSPIEMVDLMKQAGAAAEISAVFELIMRRVQGNPTK